MSSKKTDFICDSYQPSFINIIFYQLDTTANDIFNNNNSNILQALYQC